MAQRSVPQLRVRHETAIHLIDGLFIELIPSIAPACISRLRQVVTPTLSPNDRSTPESEQTAPRHPAHMPMIMTAGHSHVLLCRL